jgi:arsenate reductase
MQLLDENGINPDVVEYLNQPPTTDELNEILNLLGLEPRELMRQHETPYKELDLGKEDLSRDELIQAMINNPILIQRPIVIKGNKATIGRPPEKILDIL